MFAHSPSGLYLTLNRAYDPYSGRWLSRDPVGEHGGINLYAYVSDDPVNLTDPFGLDLTPPGGPNAPLPSPTQGSGNGGGTANCGNSGSAASGTTASGNVQVADMPPGAPGEGTAEPPCSGPLSDCQLGQPNPKLRMRGTRPTPFGNLCPDCYQKNYEGEGGGGFGS